MILSLPFQRLIRSLLSPSLVSFFSRRADIIIVSPFAGISGFNRLHSSLQIQHLRAPSERKLAPVVKWLHRVSTVLRIRGYWFRERKTLRYYWANRHFQARKDGHLKKIPAMLRPGLDLLSWAGGWCGAWRCLEFFYGRKAFQMSGLERIAQQYRRVILVQAASWGFQDAALGWLGRKHRWFSVLFPYSMDQLFCNGHLLNDFHLVCAQGKHEIRWARQFHQIPSARILSLGSFYLRELSLRKKSFHIKLGPISPQYLLYAGIAPQYFPRDLELAAVNYLAEVVLYHLGIGWQLSYRPVCVSSREISILSRSLKYRDRVRLQFPGPSSIGLRKYRDSDVQREVNALIQGLRQVRIMVTSLTTSLSLEAAQMGIPSVAYFPSSPELDIRKTRLLLDERNRPVGLESVPVATSFSDLGNMVLRLARRSRERDRIARATRELWYAAKDNFAQVLDRAIFAPNGS